MKFDVEKVNSATAGLCLSLSPSDALAILNGSVETLEIVLKAYSSTCGEKTKQRLRDAIDKYGSAHDSSSDFAIGGVDYSDTPIRGRHYVYLWFDSAGELFYIGKGLYGRARDLHSRKPEFREKAESGSCKYVAYNMDEIYALDLERILIWEAISAGRQLLNVDGGNGLDAIQYCKRDRDALLWYWNHEGTVSRFSELTGIPVIYDARNIDVAGAIDSRQKWWGEWGQRTNDPAVLEVQRKTEEKKRKQREYQANRRAKKLQVNSCRA